jgi:hypothetical protein
MNLRGVIKCVKIKSIPQFLVIAQISSDISRGLENTLKEFAVDETWCIEDFLNVLKHKKQIDLTSIGWVCKIPLSSKVYAAQSWESKDGMFRISVLFYVGNLLYFWIRKRLENSESYYIHEGQSHAICDILTTMLHE